LVLLEFAVEPLTKFIQEHLVWAGPVLGLITFGESMAIIGAFFPATALMLVTGSLIAGGVLDPWSVLAWCIGGAVLGDAVSYYIGRRVGSRVLRHRVLKPHRRGIARARLFFRYYGVASIFICRFTGPVRAFVPLIAGVTAMKQLRFQLANIGSAIVWVPVMLAPGYLATKGMASGGDYVEWIALGVVALLIGAWLFFRMLNKRAMTARPRRVRRALSGPTPAVSKG
jgi:membrane protein DedA with SNARE-associated domain